MCLGLMLIALEMLAIKIDRAIVSSNDNHMYLDFWPIVAKAWHRIGIKPTLALVSDNYIEVDESVGDVIRIKPIQGVSTALHVQVIRLFIPMYFPDEVSIISDIDMIPLSRHYFTKDLQNLPDNKFIVFRDKGYGPHSKQYPMCYNAAKGHLFKEIFGVHELSEIPEAIKRLALVGYGWSTDEIMLVQYLHKWPRFKTHCILRGEPGGPRIDRSNWNYNTDLLDKDFYVDCHSLRPYNAHKEKIDQLMRSIGIE